MYIYKCVFFDKHTYVYICLYIYIYIKGATPDNSHSPLSSYMEYIRLHRSIYLYMQIPVYTYIYVYLYIYTYM
jgi:hypothetical protein